MESRDDQGSSFTKCSYACAKIYAKTIPMQARTCVRARVSVQSAAERDSTNVLLGWDQSCLKYEFDCNMSATCRCFTYDRSRSKEVE